MTLFRHSIFARQLQKRSPLLQRTAWFLAMIEVNDATGRTIQLRDFGTAGQNGVPYISWLPAKNIAALEFSERNPLRSRPVEP
jgi:hypothetical protein